MFEDDFDAQDGVNARAERYVILTLEEVVDSFDPFEKSDSGDLFAKDEGGKHDFEEAVKSLCRAVEADNSGAMTNLGVCYAKGEGVEQSWKEAVKWFRRAAAKGDEEAIAALKRLGEYL